jgi:hypothetical protein
MLAPWEPEATLRADCRQSMALPAESGSMAPALQMVVAQILDMSRQKYGYALRNSTIFAFTSAGRSKWRK